MIKGKTIILLNKVQKGVDAFNRPIYDEEAIEVENCLYMPASITDRVETLNLTGRRVEYTVSVPKGDDHNWENQVIIINGRKYKVFTPVEETIDELTPLRWNKKFKVEAYE